MHSSLARMSRKRCHWDVDAVDVMVLDNNNVPDQQQQHLFRDSLQQQQHQDLFHPDADGHQQCSSKRSCGTASHPAPGQLRPEDVATYLHGLSSHLNNCQLDAAGQVLSTEGWQAFAELNLLLGRCLNTGALPEELMRNYHSFVLQPRASLWQVYSSYAASQSSSMPPQQLQLIRFLLEWVLAPYPDCGLTTVTLQLPPWMVSWASRWGMTRNGNRVTLVVLEAYPSRDPTSSSAAGGARKPARTLFVPAIM